MDLVVLELRPDPGDPETSGDLRTNCRLIEAWNLTDKDWTGLRDEIVGENLDIVVQRDVLVAQSIYFRALFSNFREAGAKRINVNWETGSFLYLLQFMYHIPLNVASSRAANLLEAATFFGVDNGILGLEKWTNSASLSKDPGVIDEVLKILPHLWSKTNLLGHQSLSNWCAEFLAVKFVAVMDLNSFVDLPSTLLRVCIAHPQLTVHSERQLCEALLRWYENQDRGLGCGELTKDMPTSMLSQVQKNLLPKDFLLGRLTTHCPLDSFNSIIRITDYSECLDLSGCHEVTDQILFTSHANALGQLADKRKENGTAVMMEPNSTICRNGSPSRLPISPYDPLMGRQNWPKIQSFGNLKRLIFSQCWGIPQHSLVRWLGEACPNLLALTLRNCPQIKISIMQALSAVCPLLEVADFSLGMIHVSKELQKYQNNETHSRVYEDTSGLWRCSLPHLTKLSLRGRTEVSDLLLIAISVCSPALLDIDLSMCTALTDGGISRFLKAYPNGLKALRANHTAFGSRSCAALASPGSGISKSVGEASEGTVSSTSRGGCLPLATLDLESCSGVEKGDFSSILRAHSSLTHLSLGETNLTDTVLTCFSGTSLQQLHVRETQVSGKVLTSVIRSNPELRILDIQGCKRACIDEYDLVPETDSDLSAIHDATFHVPHVFQELGRHHMLEELKLGWGFDCFAQQAINPTSVSLKNLSLGVGAMLNNSLEHLSDHCTSLQQLTLRFQVITEDGLIGFLDKSKFLRVLELQYCQFQLSSRAINALATRCASSLSILKLEWVVPWIRDSDISVLSEGCACLSNLSLVGCRALTSESLKIIAKKWSGLTELKLEECEGLTSGGADCLLKSCCALEILILRHTGRGLTKDFVINAIIQFPLMRHLSLDMCDGLANGFQTPTQARGVLNTLFLSRCKRVRHGLHQNIWTSGTSNSSRTRERSCPADTTVMQWNTDGLKEYVVKERL